MVCLTAISRWREEDSWSCNNCHTQEAKHPKNKIPDTTWFSKQYNTKDNCEYRRSEHDDCRISQRESFEWRIEENDATYLDESHQP